MITIRNKDDRGHADYGWLDTHHTFSFGNYQDPEHMGFRSLRVMNEDRVRAGAGFGEHPHRDMEIVTYILEGQLEHKDSMGNGSVLEAGHFQRITAGTGVMHSEFNPSPEKSTHFYQIWIEPDAQGLPPGYEEIAPSPEEKNGRWRLVASPDGGNGSMTIHQDVRLFIAGLSERDSLNYALAADRHAWLQVLRGSVRLNGTSLSAGDGASLSEKRELTVLAEEDAEVLLFDLN